MHDLVLLLILVSLVLIFVSVLLRVRLHELGASRGTAVRIIVEVWATFALIIGVMALARQQLGDVPRGPSIGAEFALTLRMIGSLPVGMRWLLLGGLVLVLVLFAHLIWSLRQVARGESEGGTHDATTQ